MLYAEYSFLVETLEELKYRKGVIQSMCADWLKYAIIKNKEYDTYIENLQTAFSYLDFAVATLQGVLDVAKRKKEETDC